MKRTRASARSSRLSSLLVTCAAAAAIVACGKKGPPLPPLVRLPAAPQQVTAARMGREIFLSFTIPSANVDRSTPVDLGYIDVYAYTGPSAPRTGFIEMATQIARVPVSPVPLPGDAPAPSDTAATVGSTVTIVDTVPDAISPDTRRFYLAVPFSTRERPGPQHTPVEVRFPPMPAAPSGVEVTYTASAVSVTWMPMAGAPGTAPRVNVYRETSAARPPEPAWRAVRPMPLNSAPLQAPPFSEPVTFGSESCYVLRSIVGEGPTLAEGEPSPPVCVRPVDRFPPAAPAQLVAVATAGAVNLLWEANAEPDLAGYLVLRGNVGDARLQPLTPMPITDVRYTDATVVAGMRYVYAVVAVDRQVPAPNVSPESVRVEETAQ